MSAKHLYYVYDPMCAWCWAYQPTLLKVEDWLTKKKIPYTKLLGGLAPDSDQDMPLDMQQRIEGYWHRIHDLLGTKFNHDFWRECSPRRSTYPACRATLLAREHGLEDAMNAGIQHAYYLQSRNPSNTDVLCSIADDLNINVEEFQQALAADSTQQALHQEIGFARSIGGTTFPSWQLVEEQTAAQLHFEYNSPDTLIRQIEYSFQ